MSETWGPWIKHVPGPCPVPVGTEIEIEAITLAGAEIRRLIVDTRVHEAANWRLSVPFKLMHSIAVYRVRSFGALDELRALVAHPGQAPPVRVPVPDEV